MLVKLRQRFNPEPWERTLYILFFVQLFTAVGYSSIFPFLPLYVAELGSAYGLKIELLAGWVFSAQAISMMIASPIWGNLADRFGRKLMIQRAQYGGAVLLTMMAFVQNAEQLVLLRGIQGLVTGTIAANSALVAATAPRHRSGYAMGLLQVGLGAGLAAGPLLGGALADAFSYHAAFYGTGLLLLISGLMVTLYIREPEQIDPETRRKKSNMLKGWALILRTPGVSATYGMRFMSRMARMMIVPILPLFIAALISDSERMNTFIGLVLGAFSAASTLSGIYLGRLGDRIGHRKVLLACLAAAGIAYLPQALVGDAWHLLWLSALAGVAVGGVIPMISALLANHIRQGDEGAAYGLDNSIAAAGRAAAPLVGSWIASMYGFRAVFTATAGVFFAAALYGIAFIPKE